MTLSRFAGFMLALLSVFTLPLEAQNRTRFAGRYNALDFAYGRVAGAAPLTVAPGVSTAAGVATLLLNTGWTTLGDGTTVFPLATNAPITVSQGSTQETVTPTAVSGCTVYGIELQCNVTATFTYAHGNGDSIMSGTMGVQEAVNFANANGGGEVVVDGRWGLAGGTNAIIATVSPTANVVLEDNRSQPFKYWSMQPTTLTVLAAPTTLTATNIVFTSATGTWAASSTHFRASCVDGLGGESAGSADYTQTPTLNYTLTVPVPPTCGTGAVGWRLYAGTTSAATSYLLPITAANCTLTTGENVFPACALTATGTWATTFTTTTNLVPIALGVTNSNNPVPQGHTTFAYEPSGSVPVPFQSNFGPFGSGTIASATASAVTPLGSFNLPAGYQNVIGRTVRVTGKINLTAGASSTLGIFIGTTWAGGVTAGLPVTVCNPVSGFVFATAASVVDFSCTMTTNAVGATAVGSIQPESWFLGNTAAGTGSTSPQGVEVSATAVGSLGLFSQNEYTVYITPLVAADTTVQLMSLHIETLQ